MENLAKEQSEEDGLTIYSKTYRFLQIYLKNRYSQIVVFLIFIGSILRLYHLDFNSFFYDEVLTAQFAQRSLTEIFQLITIDRHPPLFYWIEHFMLFFGQSDIIFRIIPAICGILVIPVFYVLGKEYVGQDIGLIAAVLITFSPFGIYYSQDARNYSLALLLVSIALLFYIKALKNNTPKNWILFSVFSVLTFWTDFYAILPIGFAYSYAFILYRNEIIGNIQKVRGLVISFVVFAISVLPVFLPAIQAYELYTSAVPSWGEQGIFIAIGAVYQLFGYNLIGALILFLFLMIGLRQIMKNQKNAYFIVLYLIIPVLITMYLSTKMDMSPRNLYFLIPILFLGISCSYQQFPPRLKKKQFLFVLLSVCVLIGTPYLATYYMTNQKMDWRGFSSILMDKTQSGDYVVLFYDWTHVPLDYYYNHEVDQTIEFDAQNWHGIDNLLYPGHEPIFLVAIDIFTTMGGVQDPILYPEEQQLVEKLGAKEVGNSTGIHLYLVE
jgi:mannosyltransferase